MTVLQSRRRRTNNNYSTIWLDLNFHVTYINTNIRIQRNIRMYILVKWRWILCQGFIVLFLLNWHRNEYNTDLLWERMILQSFYGIRYDRNSRGYICCDLVWTINWRMFFLWVQNISTFIKINVLVINRRYWRQHFPVILIYKQWKL